MSNQTTQEANVPQQAANEEQTAPIKSLDQFASLITNWNANTVALLQHMMEIPEGTKVEIVKEGKTETMEMSGTMREGFLLGLFVAMSEIKELPFSSRNEEVTIQ